jgi:hypothetical protein
VPIASLRCSSRQKEPADPRRREVVTRCAVEVLRRAGRQISSLPRAAGFPGSGLKPWHFFRGRSQSLERFKRWSVYAPAILVCPQPRLARTVIAIRRFYQAGRPQPTKPPSVLSPFAQLRCYLHWGDVDPSPLRALPPPSSLLRAHVPLPLGSPLLQHLASFEESLQVVTQSLLPTRDGPIGPVDRHGAGIARR